jgi:ketosteroid isomerase-like protein
METTNASPSAPQFAAAGSFLEAIAAQDFDRIARTLEADASLSALLPRGLDERHGPAEIKEAFEGWFGDADEFEVIDASVGQVGARVQLRWRVRMRAERRGPEPMVAEQHVYADFAPNGRIRSMRLLCSGFCTEHSCA